MLYFKAAGFSARAARTGSHNPYLIIYKRMFDYSTAAAGSKGRKRSMGAPPLRMLPNGCTILKETAAPCLQRLLCQKTEWNFCIVPQGQML